MSGSESVDHGTAKLQSIAMKLTESCGGSYSSSLGINLASMDSGEVFKWFVASLLLGGGASDAIATKAYRGLEKLGALSPVGIFKLDEAGVAGVLQRSGYAKRVIVTAENIMTAVRGLQDRYGGDLNRLHFFAEDEQDLERRLRGLRGIGRKPAIVFLRGLRGLWDKAEPRPLDDVVLAIGRLGLATGPEANASLEALQLAWEATGQDERGFADFEVALARLGQRYCRKGRCQECPVGTECQWRPPSNGDEPTT